MLLSNISLVYNSFSDMTVHLINNTINDIGKWNCTTDTNLNFTIHCLEFPNDHDCYPSVNMEPTNIIITIIGTWTIFNIVIGTLGNLFTIIGLSFSAKRKM